MDFQGKSVVITGGATGIGHALAKRIGAAGARIILFEPRADKIAEAVAALGALGIEALSVAGDVTDAAAVEALADFARDQHGRADAIIATCARLNARIEERFHGAGLSKVAQEVLSVARETTANIERIRRPRRA